MDSKFQIIKILFPNDELRHLYEAPLLSGGLKVSWGSSVEELISSSEPKTKCVVVDLDCLKKPIDTELELVRTNFSESEIIGISESDSAEIALKCMRAGFGDFLLKPVSPEELLWSINKSLQRQKILKRLRRPKYEFIRTITRISSATTSSLLRFYVLEYLIKCTKSKEAFWIEITSKTPVICSVPKNADLSYLSKYDLKNINDPLFFKEENGKLFRLYFPCFDKRNGGILLTGLSEKLSNQKLNEIRLIVDHAEMCLVDLQKYDEIKQQNFIDDLTGLYNSRYLGFALNRAISVYNNTNKPFAVLFIDVDHFKNINDNHGHIIGSSFLITIGKTIRNAVRHHDLVFRYGGDEFIVLLQNSNQNKAYAIAERIRKRVERKLFVFGQIEISTTVSIGIAVYPEHTKEREKLLKLADKAMYEAKNISRNSVYMALTEYEKPLSPST